MENLVESLIKDFKDLKQENKRMTIDEFVAEHPDVAGELAPRLYFDMFQAWVNKTIKRKANDWIRYQGAIKRGGYAVPTPIDDTTEDDIPYNKILISPANPDGGLFREEIIKAFEQLPEKRKQICFLYYVEKYKDREIGEMLRMKTNTVTVERWRGAKKVKEILRRWGYR